MSLLLQNLTATYPGGRAALHGVDLEVADGGVTALLGANGAGKTTTLRAISGMVGRSGSISFDGREISRFSPDKVARLGIAHVPQGRGTLTGLSVIENLLIGAVMRKDRKAVKSDLDRSLELFPRLQARRDSLAGYLSGGEQQMLAIARALMTRPKILLLDEPSLGLAPKITLEVFDTIRRLQRESGVSMLIVEQNANLALDLADQAVILENGEVVLSGTAEALVREDAVRRAYLGS